MTDRWHDPLADDEDADPFYVALVSGVDPPTLADLFARPEWHAQAACRGVGTDAFYLEKGGDPRPARELCAGCEVADPCRDAADRFGIWAGTSPIQRGRAGREAA